MPEGSLRNYETPFEKAGRFWDAWASPWRDVATMVFSGAVITGVMVATTPLFALATSGYILKASMIGAGAGYLGSLADRYTD